MKSLDIFMPRVIPYVVGCTDPMAKQALVDAAVEFCVRTNAVWQQATLASRVGVAEYDIDVPAQMDVARVIEVYYGTARLRANDRADVDDPLALRGAVNGSTPTSGTPAAFFAAHGEGTFKVYPVPDTATALVFTVRASFTPTRNATQLDDVLYTKYIDVLACGAIAYLAAIPGQMFTSKSAADYHRQKFNFGLSRAITDGRKGAVMSSTRVKARAFA